MILLNAERDEAIAANRKYLTYVSSAIAGSFSVHVIGVSISRNKSPN